MRYSSSSLPSSSLLFIFVQSSDLKLEDGHNGSGYIDFQAPVSDLHANLTPAITDSETSGEQNCHTPSTPPIGCM